jgi:DNA-binding CsgD family transcriptional regulator
MSDTLARYPNKITPVIGGQAQGSVPRRPFQLAQTNRTPDLPDPGPTVAALLALNAALIGRNSALLAALDRYDRTAGGGAGYSPHVAHAAPKRVALRVVSSVALAVAERRGVAQTASALAALTPRQAQILQLVLAGHPSKNIAADLNISQRTVENHRAAIMRRTGATSLPALARMAVGAAGRADCKIDGHFWPCRDGGGTFKLG